MKKIIHTILYFIVLCSCTVVDKENMEDVVNSSEQSAIKISQDTLILDIPGHVTSGALYQNNYYLFFHDENDRDTLGNINSDKLYRISLDGNETIELNYPEPFKHSFNCSFTIRNDSLIANTQWEDAYYLNSETLKWTKVEYRPPVIYEDEDFRVSQICHGEFGGIVTFFDKTQGNYYDGRSTCAVTVNKLNNNYYVTTYLGHLIGWSKIIKVENPRRLHKRDSKPEGEWYKLLDKLNKGTELVFDSAWLTIHSSFLYNNNLYHIYSNDSICAIGEYNDGNLKEHLRLSVFPSLQHRLDNNGQFLTFLAKSSTRLGDYFVFGVMEIIDGELRMHHINSKNTDIRN